MLRVVHAKRVTLMPKDIQLQQKVLVNNGLHHGVMDTIQGEFRFAVNGLMTSDQQVRERV